MLVAKAWHNTMEIEFKKKEAVDKKRTGGDSYFTRKRSNRLLNQLIFGKCVDVAEDESLVDAAAPHPTYISIDLPLCWQASMKPPLLVSSLHFLLLLYFSQLFSQSAVDLLIWQGCTKSTEFCLLLLSPFPYGGQSAD